MGCESATIELQGDDLDDPRSTSELVLSLRKHFHVSEFTKVSGILSSREDKMKREIEEKRRENESLVEMIQHLQEESLLKISLEKELQKSENKCVKLNQQVSYFKSVYGTKFKETEKELQRVRSVVDGGGAGGLETEGTVGATASVAGGEKVDEASKLDIIMDLKKENKKLENGVAAGIGIGIGSHGNANLKADAADHGGFKVDEASKLDIIMDVKKENEKLENGGAARIGIGIGSDGNAKLKADAADHGGFKVDQLGAGNQGTCTPKSAKIIIDLDSDDEPTPPKEGTTKPHSEPSPSGKDRAHVVKRKWSDTAANNDNSCRDDKKITGLQDGEGETASAQQKLGSIQDKETMAAGQLLSDRKILLDYNLDAESSSSSDSSFDINQISEHSLFSLVRNSLGFIDRRRRSAAKGARSIISGSLKIPSPSNEMGCEMATIKLPDDDDLDDPRTTSELVLSLRNHFHISKFTKVAAILSSREEKMKREIEEKAERIGRLDEEMLKKISLEVELRRSKNECSELKKQVSVLRGYEIKDKEVENRLARVSQRVRCELDGGVGSSGRGDSQAGGLEAEGSVDAATSVAGGEKVDEASKPDIIMDVMKENVGAAGIGSDGNADLEADAADHGGCKVDQLGAGIQGTTIPKSAKVIIDILDSDDESTPPKAAPKERTTQPLVEAGPSGVLKRKRSDTDTGTTDENSSRDDKKITIRLKDSIPHGDGETTSVPPCSRQEKETPAAGKLSDAKSLLDYACKLDADHSSSSSSSSSSDSGFDINQISYLL
ncbi:hypothetical protein LINGRAHAP2_LOCUS3074 [Linum grandiflorum]